MAYSSEREALRQIHEGASGTLRYKGGMDGDIGNAVNNKQIINQ